MEDLALIDRELTALAQIQAALATIALREDDARKRDLVGLRRRLAAQIAQVGRLSDPIFAQRSDMNEDYRAKFSAMRSAAALHQASWPAVLIDDRPEEHRASAQRVRDANMEFVTWMRAALTHLQHGGDPA